MEYPATQEHFAIRIQLCVSGAATITRTIFIEFFHSIFNLKSTIYAANRNAERHEYVAALLSKSWLHTIRYGVHCVNFYLSLLQTKCHWNKQFCPFIIAPISIYTFFLLFFPFMQIVLSYICVEFVETVPKRSITLYAYTHAVYNIICKTSYKIRHTWLCVLQSTENFHQINYRVGMEWTNQNQNRTENRGQLTKRWLKNWNESHSLANDFSIMLAVRLAA